MNSSKLASSPWIISSFISECCIFQKQQWNEPWLSSTETLRTLWLSLICPWSSRVLTKHTDTWLPGWSRCPGSGRLRPCSSSPADLHTSSCWWRRGNRAAELLPCQRRCPANSCLPGSASCLVTSASAHSAPDTSLRVAAEFLQTNGKGTKCGQRQMDEDREEQPQAGPQEAWLWFVCLFVCLLIHFHFKVKLVELQSGLRQDCRSGESCRSSSAALRDLQSSVTSIILQRKVDVWRLSDPCEQFVLIKSWMELSQSLRPAQTQLN